MALLDLKGDWTLMGGNRAAKEFTHISCTFGMMRAAFGPVLPATHRSGPVVVRAAKTGPDFAREVSEGTRYVGEKCSSRAVPTSAAVDHSGPRGAVAQQKHSLATSSCFFSAFLFLIWLHTYGTGDNLAFWSHCQRDSCKDRAFKIRTTQQNRRAVISALF